MDDILTFYNVDVDSLLNFIWLRRKEEGFDILKIQDEKIKDIFIKQVIFDIVIYVVFIVDVYLVVY